MTCHAIGTRVEAVRGGHAFGKARQFWVGDMA